MKMEPVKVTITVNTQQDVERSHVRTEIDFFYDQICSGCSEVQLHCGKIVRPCAACSGAETWTLEWYDDWGRWRRHFVRKEIFEATAHKARSYRWLEHHNYGAKFAVQDSFMRRYGFERLDTLRLPIEWLQAFRVSGEKLLIPLRPNAAFARASTVRIVNTLLACGSKNQLESLEVRPADYVGRRLVFARDDAGIRAAEPACISAYQTYNAVSLENLRRDVLPITEAGVSR